jgi:hypothetical protein
MNPKTIKEAIEITKRDGRASVAVFKEELHLSNQQIQEIIQLFYDVEFIGPNQILCSIRADEHIEHLEAERDREWKKKKEYEAWLAGAALTILVLFVALFL